MHVLTFAPLLHALAAADPSSVLVMPIAAKTEALAGLVDQITDIFTLEASKVPGFKIVSVAELAGAMTHEQMKQMASCDGLSCAAELGGVLNTEQVIIGSLGKLGSEYLLTITRIQ